MQFNSSCFNIHTSNVLIVYIIIFFRQLSNSQSLRRKVSLGDQSRGRQQRQQQPWKKKIGTNHRTMDKTFVVLAKPLLPSAYSLFINAKNRMSLRYSTAGICWATLDMPEQSSSLTTGLCWLRVDTTKSSACGTSAARHKSKEDNIQLYLLK